MKKTTILLIITIIASIVSILILINLKPQPPKPSIRPFSPTPLTIITPSPTPKLTPKPIEHDCSGLVDIKSITKDIIIEMRYATANTFFKRIFYPQNTCYLRKDVALSLSVIQKSLKKKGLGLKCWDCYRPFSIQKKLWEQKPDSNYVANPYNGGSRHNKGASVDITLVDYTGRELSLPTDYDDFSVKASHSYNKLTPEQINNRKILKEAMMSGHFLPIGTEWWHYDYVDYKKYGLLDISFEDMKQCFGIKK